MTTIACRLLVPAAVCCGLGLTLAGDAHAQTRGLAWFIDSEGLSELHPSDLEEALVAALREHASARTGARILDMHTDMAHLNSDQIGQVAVAMGEQNLESLAEVLWEAGVTDHFVLLRLRGHEGGFSAELVHQVHTEDGELDIHDEFNDAGSDDLGGFDFSELDGGYTRWRGCAQTRNEWDLFGMAQGLVRMAFEKPDAMADHCSDGQRIALKTLDASALGDMEALEEDDGARETTQAAATGIPGGMVCAPASTQACECWDGRDGVASCYGDGRGFGECNCRGSSWVPWTLIGVAGASLATSAAMGGLALSEASALRNENDAQRFEQRRQNFERDRIVAFSALGLAAVTAAVGAWMLTSEDEVSEDLGGLPGGVRVLPQVSADGSAGVTLELR